jgi:hypothetical protein
METSEKRIFKPSELTAKQVHKSLESYYDAHRKEYLIKNMRGGWIAITETQFKRILTKEGVSSSSPKNGGLSPLDDYLVYLQRNKDVYYVGPLAGQSAGFYEIGESRILVTTSPKIIFPEKGEWPVLGKFVTNLFPRGDHDQLPYIYGWIKIAFEALSRGHQRPGQALVIAGPHACGKSLFQSLITVILGGRMARPYQFMMNVTTFNSDLFEAEHLAMEDEHASTDLRARRHFGSQIKSITVNPAQRCHPKHQKALVLSPFWRVTVSLNDEPENMMVLPPMDDSLEDKLMLFKAEKHPMPMPTITLEQRKDFWNKLLIELPAFLDFLMSWEIPQELSSERFGIKEFHHPELLEALTTLAPEFKLLSLIDTELFAPYVADVWHGSAEKLERELTGENSPCRVEARRLFSFNTACGVYLGRLHKKYPERFKYQRDSSSRTWNIHAPKEWPR